MVSSSVEPDTSERILRELARFRYLIPEQFHMLGVTSARSHLHETLRTLASRKPVTVTKLDFGAVPGLGRLPVIHALTPHGRDVLIEHDPTFEGLTIPQKPRLFRSDYLHRVRCADFHIGFDAWAREHSMTVDFFETYYDPSPRRAVRTRITLRSGSFNPDALFAFTDEEERQRLYAFELYNGRDTTRVINQLITYTSALSDKAIEKARSYHYNARVLCVFDEPEGLALVMQAMQQQRQRFDPYRPYFFLTTADRVWCRSWPRPKGEADTPNLYKNWVRFDGEPTTLF